MLTKDTQSFADPLRQIDRSHVLWRGRKLVYFGGCDYLRLSMHAEVLRAVSAGLKEHGLNVAASRKTTGNHPLYERLEKQTARFFAAESATLVSNGYLTNLVAAQALAGSIKEVLIDARAHASLKDAATFLGCRVKEFRHLDDEDLAKKAARLEVLNSAAVLTDGLFAHNGRFAPLKAYRDALGPEVLLWVDDSHAAGIAGKNGRGTCEAPGFGRQHTIQTVTFSKGFGVYGGAVLCSRAFRKLMVERSTALIGNTPLPLPLAAGVLKAMELVRSRPEIRGQLARNIELFWSELGVKPSAPLAPIVTLTPAEPRALWTRLLRKGIFPSLIRYPGCPAEGYFRFALSSGHSPQQVRALAEVLAGAEILTEQ